MDDNGEKKIINFKKYSTRAEAEKVKEKLMKTNIGKQYEVKEYLGF